MQWSCDVCVILYDFGCSKPSATRDLERVRSSSQLDNFPDWPYMRSYFFYKNYVSHHACGLHVVDILLSMLFIMIIQRSYFISVFICFVWISSSISPPYNDSHSTSWNIVLWVMNNDGDLHPRTCCTGATRALSARLRMHHGTRTLELAWLTSR